MKNFAFKDGFPLYRTIEKYHNTSIAEAIIDMDINSFLEFQKQNKTKKDSYEVSVSNWGMIKYISKTKTYEFYSFYCEDYDIMTVDFEEFNEFVTQYIKYGEFQRNAIYDGKFDNNIYNEKKYNEGKIFFESARVLKK